jgi:hypothetical protein
MFQNFNGVLNTSGMAIAWLSTLGPVNPAFLGQRICFAYVLTSGPATRPITHTSLPVMINFIP